MRIEHLEIFVNAAQTQSFTKTAQNMNMSQPAVSLAISSIEKQLGYQLFSRSRRKMLLTPAGQSLYNSIKSELNDYRTAVSKAKRIAMSEGQITLKVGLIGILAEQLMLPGLIRQFRRSRDTVNIEFFVESSPVLFEKLAFHELDLVLSTPEAMPRFPDFTAYTIGKLKWCTLVPNDHPLAEKDLLSEKDLDGKDLVFLDLSCSSPLITLMQDRIEKNCKQSRIFFANNVVAQTMMVYTQQGLAIQPYTGPLDDDNCEVNGLKRVPLDVKVSSDLTLFTCKDVLNEHVLDLMNWLKAQKLG